MAWRRPSRSRPGRGRKECIDSGGTAGCWLVGPSGSGMGWMAVAKTGARTGRWWGAPLLQCHPRGMLSQPGADKRKPPSANGLFWSAYGLSVALTGLVVTPRARHGMQLCGCGPDQAPPRPPVVSGGRTPPRTRALQPRVLRFTSCCRQVQFSSSRPGTRWNSRRLLLTRVSPSLRAWAAMCRSFTPMGVPLPSRWARICP